MAKHRQRLRLIPEVEQLVTVAVIRSSALYGKMSIRTILKRRWHPRKVKQFMRRAGRTSVIRLCARDR
jgi:hypothetical protein